MMKKTNRADMCVNMWYPASTIKNEETTSCEGGNGRERERERERERGKESGKNAPICSQTPQPRSDNQIVPNTHLARPPVLLWLTLSKTTSAIILLHV
jgi:hypothetical protein